MPYFQAIRSPLVLLCLLIAVTGTGCTGLDTPAKRYAKTLSSYSTAKASLTAAYDAGLVTDSQLLQLEPIINAGDRQVQILQEDYTAGRPLTQTALDTLGNVIESIREWLALTKARK